jgi:hypothetical protein
VAFGDGRVKLRDSFTSEGASRSPCSRQLVLSQGRSKQKGRFDVKISSLIPDASRLLELGPEALGCALLKVIDSLPETLRHRKNYLMLPDAIVDYPSEFQEKIRQAQNENWEWLRNNGYIAPQVGNPDSDFIYVTKKGQDYLTNCASQSKVSAASSEDRNQAANGGGSVTSPSGAVSPPAETPPNAGAEPQQQDAQVNLEGQSFTDQSSQETVVLTTIPFITRCQRVLVAAAGYTRNRRQPQSYTLTTTAILYALIDFALLGNAEPDDAIRVIGDAVLQRGVQPYQERRQRFLKQEVPVTVFDSEPLPNALANVSANTRTLLVAAQDIARQTTLPVSSGTAPVLIDTRHLIAAMLQEFPRQRRSSGQLRLLSQLELELSALKTALYSFISEHFSSTDFMDQWSVVLSALPPNIPAKIGEEGTAETFEPRIAGYVSDSTKGSQDDLGILTDVQTLCSVILAKDVEPPLSIGLFGDWGTGKTFFMDRMREEIDFAKNQTENPNYSKFHTRVAQITFNAWHYVDANLWASLVSHILDKLVAAISPKPDDAEVRARLVQQLQTAKELRTEAQQERQRAANDREAAEAHLSEVAKERAQKQMELSSLRATDLWKLVQGDAELKKSIDSALESLGLPTVLTGLNDLDAAVVEARGVGSRIYALGASLIQDGSRGTLLVLIGILVLGIPAVEWILGSWLPGKPFVTTLSSIGSGVAAACWAISSAVRGPLRKVNEHLNRLEAAKKKASDLIARKQKERSGDEIRLEGEINALKAKEVSATEQLTAADARVREVESKIQEIDEGRNLAKFILARSEAGDYRKHLGLISTIRQDFENLSRLLQIAASVNSGDSAVQRIVLYIDDLDRCPSGRVVELLEAVHLLLAFDLFVVVVGVDPRWLLHSLQEKFSAFQADKSTAELEWVTTPQDYLEKIFQIPFSLRRMEPEGFGRLMQRLLPVTVISATTGLHSTAPTDPAPPNAPLQTAPTVQPPPSEAMSQTKSLEIPSLIAAANGTTLGMVRQLNPDSLNIRSWEAQYASRVSAFITTPRSAKRFTNIYRLLKAPLGPDELLVFEGEETSPGEFRATMLLLAILTGFPHLAAPLFGAIMKQESTSSARNFFAKVASYCPVGLEAARLQNCLNPLLPDLPEPFDAFVRWAPGVARFSFYTAKIGELNA